MVPSPSANAFWKSATARWIKWCKRHVRENRISSRAALPPAHQRRLRSSWLMWHERAWANFSRITTTFLRTRDLRLWQKNSREATFVRRLGARPDVSYKTYQTYLETRSPEVVTNILICLIHQTNYLLDRQLRQLEKTFVQEGGLRERMTRARLIERTIKRLRSS